MEGEGEGAKLGEFFYWVRTYGIEEFNRATDEGDQRLNKMADSAGKVQQKLDTAAQAGVEGFFTLDRAAEKTAKTIEKVAENTSKVAEAIKEVSRTGIGNQMSNEARAMEAIRRSMQGGGSLKDKQDAASKTMELTSKFQTNQDPRIGKQLNAMYPDLYPEFSGGKESKEAVSAKETARLKAQADKIRENLAFEMWLIDPSKYKLPSDNKGVKAPRGGGQGPPPPTGGVGNGFSEDDWHRANSNWKPPTSPWGNKVWDRHDENAKKKEEMERKQGNRHMGLGLLAATAGVSGIIAMGMAGTVQGQRMAFAWQQLSRQLAAVFLPVIMQTVHWVEQLTNWFRGLNAEQQDSIMKFGGIVGVLAAGTAAWLRYGDALKLVWGRLKSLAALSPYVLAGLIGYELLTDKTGEKAAADIQQRERERRITGYSKEQLEGSDAWKEMNSDKFNNYSKDEKLKHLDAMVGIYRSERDDYKNRIEGHSEMLSWIPYYKKRQEEDKQKFEEASRNVQITEQARDQLRGEGNLDLNATFSGTGRKAIGGPSSSKDDQDRRDMMPVASGFEALDQTFKRVQQEFMKYTFEDDPEAKRHTETIGKLDEVKKAIVGAIREKNNGPQVVGRRK